MHKLLDHQSDGVAPDLPPPSVRVGARRRTFLVVITTAILLAGLAWWLQSRTTVEHPGRRISETATVDVCAPLQQLPKMAPQGTKARHAMRMRVQLARRVELRKVIY
jgi:hypothetical protein